jgi:hypothetical protein
MLALGLALSLVAVTFLFITTRLSFQILDLILVALGLFLGIRLARCGIALGPTSLEVRGVFWTTRILRGQITSIESFPHISWEKLDGSPRQSFVFAFTGVSDGNDPNALARNRAKSQLKAWISTSSTDQE